MQGIGGRRRTAAWLVTGAMAASALLAGCGTGSGATATARAAQNTGEAGQDVALPSVELAAARTTPPKITTLGALSRWMLAATQAKGSAAFRQQTVVGTPTLSMTGVVTWAKGVPSMDVMVLESPATRIISLPGVSYQLYGTDPEINPGPGSTRVTAARRR